MSVKTTANEFANCVLNHRHKLAIVADCLSRARDGMDPLTTDTSARYADEQIVKAEIALEESRELFRQLVASLLVEGILQTDCLPFVI